MRAPAKTKHAKIELANAPWWSLGKRQTVHILVRGQQHGVQ